jgi:hypothetical protein
MYSSVVRACEGIVISERRIMKSNAEECCEE